jgi:hypothetical protein
LVLLLVIVIVIVAVALCLVLGRRKERDEWEVDFAQEVELGPLLGTGGYGQVYRATWKGTEVAVKKMVSASKVMERSFKDEVRVMTSLRHPNVVLFMGACTKAPTMCIIMEFMALGSLYEVRPSSSSAPLQGWTTQCSLSTASVQLLHNELVPEIPFELKCKMAYQAAKGMHFLHSSGIVHRDLKSLNLLLDNKWNLKVSFLLFPLLHPVLRCLRAHVVMLRCVSGERLRPDNVQGGPEEGTAASDARLHPLDRARDPQRKRQR